MNVMVTISEAVEPVDYSAVLQEIINALSRIEQNAIDIKSGIAHLFAFALVYGVFFALYKFSRSLFRDI